ncbi:MAG: hypothetical protein WBX02_10180 [Terriglobales bacterium]
MSGKASRNKPQKKSRNRSRLNRLRPLGGLLAAGLSLSTLAAAQSQEYPTYFVGPQTNGSWVVSDGQVITPAGKQVNLGIRVRAKAIALNPNSGNHTAAVLTMGTSTADGNGAVEVFDTLTGVVLQNYVPFAADPSGSYSGITYSADGSHLVFSQDSSNVTIANVNAQGLLSDNAQVYVAPNNSFIACFPNSPPAAYDNPCGSFYSGYTSYPGGVALSSDGTSAYALLNQNDTLTQIDLTATPPTQGTQIRVGQRAAQHRDQQRGHDRVREQRRWPRGYGVGLPDQLRRHGNRRRPVRWRLSDWHRFCGGSGLDDGHRYNRDRSAPDGDGALQAVRVGG